MIFCSWGSQRWKVQGKNLFHHEGCNLRCYWANHETCWVLNTMHLQVLENCLIKRTFVAFLNIVYNVHNRCGCECHFLCMFGPTNIHRIFSHLLHLLHAQSRAVRQRFFQMECWSKIFWDGAKEGASNKKPCSSFHAKNFQSFLVVATIFG